ncbi:MAG TPA: hypothetical protein VL523_14695 [Terriglobia bacterium]|nr:hypothetical protein [Terriglobia bacterium]
MTRTAKLLAVFFCFALIYSLSPPKANADEWDKKTILTFSGPVQVGKTKLDAGTYVFKLADTYDRHVVQIFNQDENQVIATVLAIPDYRLEPTGDTVIKFSETAGGNTTSGTLPEAGVPIKEWFYPGDNFGQKFKVVPQPVETAEVEPLPESAAAEPEPAPAPEAEAPAEQPAETPAAVAPEQPQTDSTPAPAPAQTDQQPAPSSESATTPESKTLPKTASLVPLIGWVSGLCLAVAGGLRALSKRMS